MEGRWARLTLQAHLQGAIDLKREISPLAESLIFNQLEVKLFKDAIKLYPALDDDGDLVYPAIKAVTLLRGLITGEKQEQETEQNDFAADIARLKLLKNE